jgi:hypothetical protein
LRVRLSFQLAEISFFLFAVAAQAVARRKIRAPVDLVNFVPKYGISCVWDNVGLLFQSRFF